MTCTYKTNSALFLLEIEKWVGTNNHEDHGHIDADSVARFRQGTYESATLEVKAKWLFCMTTLMSCINSEWSRGAVMVQHLLSERTTTPEEALLYWYLVCYVQNQWVPEIEEEGEFAARNSGSGQRFPKRQKKKSKHMSWSHLHVYIKKEKEVREARMGDITGKDWDLAVKMEMVLRADKAANPSGSSSGDDLHDSEEVQAHKLPGVDFGDMFIVPFEV